jgi:hypothetical protein
MIYSPMLRACSRVIAAIAMAAVLSTAQAAEPETLTLACQGTTTSGLEDAKPEPISMGIICQPLETKACRMHAPLPLKCWLMIATHNDLGIIVGHILQ